MATERWEVDSSHSWLHFSVRHMVIGRVRGQLTRWSATLFAETGRVERGRVEVIIDASSLDTGVADRDVHLKSRDFLHVARHPEMTFCSSKIEPRSPSRLAVTGRLTLRDVTREVTLDVECCGEGRDLWGNERAAFTARASIDRRDFGLTWNRLVEAGVLVGDRVDVEVEVEAVRQVSATAEAAATNRSLERETP
jgi:polyisoprenoid-binding protein YceI